MTEQKHPMEVEINKIKTIVENLQKRKQSKGNTLFETEPKYFWRLSDLSLMYPDVFNPQVPFSSTYIYNFNHSKTNEAFLKELDYIPVHFENIRETYNIRDSMGRMLTKNGKNQNLSNVACEHVFNKHIGYHIEQAYFIYPNASLTELYKQSEEIKLAHARQQIAQTMKELSSFINRCSCKRGPDPYALIIGNFWNTLFNAENSYELHTNNNIKSYLSPLDYMRANTLNYINKLFRNVIEQFENKDVTFDQIMLSLTDAAQKARYFFATKNTTPEACLFPDKTNIRIENVQRARVKFLSAYYPISLQK